MTDLLPIGDVEFVKELYPRLREDGAAIERYRAALDKLPPITVDQQPFEWAFGPAVEKRATA